MAEVKLYIYSGTSQGNPLQLNAETSVSRVFTTVDDGTTKATTYTYPLTLNKLTYLKKMYEPCVIHAVIEVGIEERRNYRNQSEETADPP